MGASREVALYVKATLGSGGACNSSLLSVPRSMTDKQKEPPTLRSEARSLCLRPWLDTTPKRRSGAGPA
jgi:hypothetical protein